MAKDFPVPWRTGVPHNFACNAKGRCAALELISQTRHRQRARDSQQQRALAATPADPDRHRVTERAGKRCKIVRCMCVRVACAALQRASAGFARHCFRLCASRVSAVLGRKSHTTHILFGHVDEPFPYLPTLVFFLLFAINFLPPLCPLRSIMRRGPRNSACFVRRCGGGAAGENESFSCGVHKHTHTHTRFSCSL